MADRASIPLFVPRTVAAFERSATVMARRMTAPARSLAGRALAFADRVLGSWAATSGEGERPAMRASERGGAMVVPRPWYEEPAAPSVDDDGAAVARAAVTTATAASASRGAAIARTNVTAPAPAADDAPSQARVAELRAATAQAAADVRALVETRASERAAAERTAAQLRAAAETRAAEWTAAQRAATETQAAQRAAAETQAGQRAATETQAAQRAAAETQAGQRAAAETQAGQRNTAETQAGQRAAAETRAAQRAATDRPAAELHAQPAPGSAAAPEADTRALRSENEAPADARASVRTAEAARVGLGDVRAAEALALHAAPASQPRTAAAIVARTPLARSLSHASWVDAQLRTVVAPVEPAARATAGYVFIAPADAAAVVVESAGPSRRTIDRTIPAAASQTSSAAAAQTRVPTAARTMPELPAVAAMPAGLAQTAATGGSAASLGAQPLTSGATWNPAALAALPDQRLSPSTVSQRVFDFVARLVGVQAARDASAPASPAMSAAPMTATSLRAPAATLIATVAEPALDGAAMTANDARRARASLVTSDRAATALPASAAVTMAPIAVTPSVAVSWRPGAAAARSEQLGVNVDARIGAAWGEPPARAATPATATATATVAVADGGAIARSASYVLIAPAVERAPDAARALQPTMGQATGPARLARFMDTLVGVQAARATAQLSVAPTAAAAERVNLPLTVAAAARLDMTNAAGASLTSTRAAADDAMVAPTGLSARAPARVTLASLVPASAAAAMAPGGLGVRAEQLGGAVGVRAASLSIDFVDPARLAALHGGEATVRVAAAERAASSGGDTIMPAPRPLLAMRPLAELPALTAEEWSLVATFPSAATAVQLVAARQAAHWPTAAERGQSLTQTLLAATDATRATAGTAEGGRYRASALAETSRADGLGASGRPLTTALTTAALGAAERRALASTVEPRVSAAALRGGAPTDFVSPAAEASRPMPSIASLDAARLPGGRAPRGGFLWPRLGDFAMTTQEFTASPAMAIAESANDVAPGAPLWGGLRSLVSVAPGMAADFDAGSGLTAARGSGLASARGPGQVAPSQSATVGRARDGGAPALSMLATIAGAPADRAAAARDAEFAGGPRSRGEAAGAQGPQASSGAGQAAAGRSSAAGGSTRVGAERPSLTLAAGGEAARLAAATALQGGAWSPAGPAPSPSSSAGPALVGPAARALELARPFLKLAEGSATSDGARAAGRAPRFYEQPQPLVSAQAADPAASSIVQAMRSQPSAATSDDRVTLGDLTLISMASATQQVAASAAGGGPASAGGSSSGAAGDGGHAAAGGAGDTGNPVQDIEELARAAFQELQRLITLERERSGDPWQS